MPAFNEGNLIYHNVKETRNVLEDTGFPYEIIVVDDGSTDNTLAEIKRARRDFDEVILKRNDFNMGKGWALKRGFSETSGDIIVFLDADLDLHPGQIKDLINLLEKGGYDVVITSKYHPQSRIEYPFFRRVFSIFYSFIIRLIFGLPVRDTQTGLKIFRTEVLKKVFPRMLVKKFAYDIELLVTARHFGYSIKERPVILNFRRKMKWGRISFADTFGIMLDTLAVFYRLRILKYYDRLQFPLVSKPPVSVIMASDDQNTCRQFLTDCLRLDYHDYEIVVVTVKKFDAEDSRVTVIEADSMSRIEMLNSGADKSKNDILAFIQEEAYPHQDWLLNAVRNFSDQSIYAVCGPVASAQSEHILTNASGVVSSSFLGGGFNRYRYVQRPSRLISNFPSSNLIIRKSIFNEIGGFNEENWPYEGEELSNHMTRRLGKKLLYDPDVLIFRTPKPLFVPFLNNVLKRALQRGNSIRKHPMKWTNLNAFLPTLLVLFTFIGGFFVGRWPGWEIMYGGVLSLYGLCVVLTGLMTLNVKLFFPVVVGTVLYHLVYGLLFPIGLFGIVRNYPKDGK